jgi:Tfp pilus assembly protein PilO
MKEATKQSVSILMITLVASMAIFVLNKFTLPAFSEYQKNRVTIQEKKEALKEIDGFKKLAEELHNKYNTLGGEFDKISEAIPSSPQFSDLLAILDSIGRQTEVTISDMAFRDIENKKVGTDGYSLAEVSLNMVGSYENISKFFEETEKELRLMDVVSLNMKSGKVLTTVKNKQSVNEVIQTNAIIQAYYQK